MNRRAIEAMPLRRYSDWTLCKAKLFAKRLAGREPRLNPDVSIPLKSYGDWTFCPEQLTSSPIIYSVGVGDAIGFDLDLIRDFGARVYAFDPTPGVGAWVAKQNVPDSFHFYPCAVSASDGELNLYPRVKRDGRLSDEMYTVVAEHSSYGHRVTVPSKSLATIVRELQHARIDILKLDIEGAEYGVLETLLDSPVLPRQLLVEFHHRFAGLCKQHTEATVQQLRASGYRMTHISLTAREYSFTRLGPN